jgi:hypothetical protein
MSLKMRSIENLKLLYTNHNKEKTNDFKFPSKNHIAEGNIVAIYNDPIMEEGFQGWAELIEHQPGRTEDDTLYIRKEIGARTIYYKWERWLVNIDGFRTHRKVSYYVGTERDFI